MMGFQNTGRSSNTHPRNLRTAAYVAWYSGAEKHYVTTAVSGIYHESDTRPERTTFNLERNSCIIIG